MVFKANLKVQTVWRAIFLWVHWSSGYIRIVLYQITSGLQDSILFKPSCFVKCILRGICCIFGNYIAHTRQAVDSWWFKFSHWLCRGPWCLFLLWHAGINGPATTCIWSNPSCWSHVRPPDYQELWWPSCQQCADWFMAIRSCRCSV